MRPRLLSQLTIVALALCCWHIAAQGPAQAPFADNRSGVLNLTDPDVRTWATIFQRYYSLSLTLAQRAGTNKTVSYETIFLLANAALSAAAAKNVEAAIESSVATAEDVKSAINYSLAAGRQTIIVSTSPEAKQLALLNVTAYTQVAGESAMISSNAASNGSQVGASAAADRAVVAASSGLFEAERVVGPTPAPTDLPY